MIYFDVFILVLLDILESNIDFNWFLVFYTISRISKTHTTHRYHPVHPPTNKQLLRTPHTNKNITQLLKPRIKFPSPSRTSLAPEPWLSNMSQSIYSSHNMLNKPQYANTQSFGSIIPKTQNFHCNAKKKKSLYAAQNLRHNPDTHSHT